MIHILILKLRVNTRHFERAAILCSSVVECVKMVIILFIAVVPFFNLVTGQIRTTIGQGQLLIDQRFRQFSGLIDLSEVSYSKLLHTFIEF